jgi:transport and Golgi organization protein 2
MCTVTYIPAGESVFITSNRDERSRRAPALYPAVYTGRSGRLLYPKDAQAGGSWFAVHEQGHILVLLNGAFVRHIPQPPYKRSRGTVLLELTDSISPLQRFQTLDLYGIEPFTLILLEDGKLHECRWDGMMKHHLPLCPDQPYIWSSVTLYAPDVSQKRQKWFEEWLLKGPNPDQDEILRFHQFTGDGDRNNDLLMNRDNLLLTVSITVVRCSRKEASMKYVGCSGHNVSMKYVDILGQQDVERTLTLAKPVLQ